jgi:response regulator RpfG family c-di-GMP phosphodiesterase
MNEHEKPMGFAAEAPTVIESGEGATKWNVLVVDDEKIVHTVTSMVLQDLIVDDHGINFLSAYSGEEARRIYREQSGIAVAFVDVVMETEHAGLEFVQWLREEMHDEAIRIIIRTGQPGSAPEQEIIRRYDINDYKEKTELTSTRLATTLTVAIRGYHQITTIQRSREGFRRIVDATAAFWRPHAVSEFIEGVITQFGALVADRDAVLVEVSGVGAQDKDGTMLTIGSTGRFAGMSGKPVSGLPDPEVQQILETCRSNRRTVVIRDLFATYLPTRHGVDSILFVKLPRSVSDVDVDLLEVYSRNVAIAFENLSLSLKMDESQKETIYLLGELVEKRSESTGNHVRRVGRIVEMLGTLTGEVSDTVGSWQMAASLHDIGKIAIPDGILYKEGSLTPEEYRLMQSHTTVGHDVLSKYDNEMMRVAATVCRSHHENWDGSGYPDGIAGDAIPVAARMTAIADVFDALTHTRSYKDAWSVDDAFRYILDHSGKKFDPYLTDRFAELRLDLEDLLQELPD